MKKRILIIAIICNAALSLLGQEEVRLGLPIGHNSVRFTKYSPDGAQILTASYDGTCKIWDASSGKLFIDLNSFNSPILSIDYSPDGKMIAVATLISVQILDAQGGQLLHDFDFDFKGFGLDNNKVKFVSDGEKLVAIDTYYGDCIIWDVETGSILKYFNRISCMSLSGEKLLVPSNRSKRYNIWDVESCQKTAKLEVKKDGLRKAYFSPDESKVVVMYYDSSAHVFDALNGEFMYLIDSVDCSYRFTFSFDGKKMKTHSVDNMTKIRDAESGKFLSLLSEFTDDVEFSRFSPDGKTFITNSIDNTAKIWDAESGLLISNIKLDGEKARFSPNGKRIISWSEDSGNVKIWDVETGRLDTELKGYALRGELSINSSDGKMVTTAFDNHIVYVWDIESGEVLSNLTGHKGDISVLKYSPDSTKIITVSDSTIKVWDAQDGEYRYDLLGHSEKVESVQFSPDGKKIVTASSDNTAKIWDAETGEILFSLEGHKYLVNSAQFSPDGKKIVTASWSTSKIWDVESGKLIYTIESSENEVIYSCFSPEGEYLLTISEDYNDQELNVWDAWKGTLLHRFDTRGGFFSANFSNDAHYILTKNIDNWGEIIDWKSGNQMSLEATRSVPRYRKGTNGTYLFDFINNDHFYVTLSLGLDSIVDDWLADFDDFGNTNPSFLGPIYSINTLKFSPYGEDVLVTTYDSIAKDWIAVKDWNVFNGVLLYIFSGFKSNIISAQFSLDGEKIVTLSEDSIIKIWDLKTGELVCDLEGSSIGTRQFLFFQDSIIIFNEYDCVMLYNMNNGEFIDNFSLLEDNDKIAPLKKSIDGEYLDEDVVAILDMKKEDPFVLKERDFYDNTCDFSVDEKKIVSTSFYNTAKVWDAETGKLLFSLEGHTDDVQSIQFSPDGKRIVTASMDKTAKVWDTETGKLLFSLEGHTGEVEFAQFSPDGKRIVTASEDGSAKIWNSEDGRLLLSIEGLKDEVLFAKFSDDGETIITYLDTAIKVWDANTFAFMQDEYCYDGYYLYIHDVSNDFSDGKIEFLNRLDYVCKKNNIDINHIYKVGFSHNGSKFFTKNYDYNSKNHRTTLVFDSESGELLYNLNRRVYNAEFTIDDRFLLINDLNNKTIILDAQTGKILYTRLQLQGGDWLVYDEHYRYDGTQAARDYLYFVCGTEIIDLAQMKDALYVPGLVEKIMNGEDINYQKLSDLKICGALPLVEQNDNSKYAYTITQRTLEIDRVEVYVNDKLVQEIPVSALDKNGNTFNLELAASDIEKHFIPGAENTVNVIAIVKKNGSELKSRGAELIEEDEAELANPRLFAVMVGVNDYKDDVLDLNFPAKDASDLSKAVQESAGLLLGEENVFMYNVTSAAGAGNFTTPEKEGIKKALAEIGAKAEPQDIIMLFFAGHGFMVGEEDKKFTLLTAEASKLNPVGITMDELHSWLSYDGPFKILANKTILIFDACHSGQATEELIGLSRSDEETKRIRQVEDLRDKTGMFILAASASDQSAYELPQYEQGLLTYSLLYTLKNNPEILDEGQYLNVQKWFLESEEYLQDLVENMGYEQDAQPFGTANIRVGLVNEDVKNNIHLAEEKPVIMCANVINPNTFEDDLGLKEKVNNYLNEASSRSVETSYLYAPKETSSVNKINILYTVEGEKVICQVKLSKNGKELNQQEVKGKKNNLDALVKDIVDGVVLYVE